QQVPAFTGAAKIRGLGHALQRGTFASVHEFLTAAANIVNGRAIASPSDEGAGIDDIAPGDAAVEADKEEATRSQQRGQDPPSRLRIRQMVQDAGGLDHVERAVERRQFEYVGLRVVDVIETELPSLSHGITQARYTEIDRKHTRARPSLRDFD